MWDLIKKSRFFQTLEALIEQEPSLLFEQLWETPQAILAFFLAEQAHKHVVIIKGRERETGLFEDLNFFAKNKAKNKSKNKAKNKVLAFPSLEILPGEAFLQNPDIIGKRLETLHYLSTHQGPHILLTPLQGVLQKLCPPTSLKKQCLTWKKGDTFPFETLPTLLTELGYQREGVAADKGQFALRGGILDLFPVSAFDPYRIDFFGDEIDQIRTYDPISQKSIEKKESVFITPALELELLKKEKNLCTLFDYLGPQTTVIFDDLLAIEDRYVALKHLSKTSSSSLLSFSQLQKQIAQLQKVYFAKEPIETLSQTKSETKPGRKFYTGKTMLQALQFDIFDHTIKTKRASHPFLSLDAFLGEDVPQEKRLESLIQKGKEMEMVFLTASEAEENALKDNLNQTMLPLPKKRTFSRGYLTSGFVLPDIDFILCPYTELTKRYRVSRQKWRNTYHTPASEFHALEVGDLVVHFHNGIGKYLGIEKQTNHLGNEEEFLIIEYANASKLFVPLSQSHLISRYIGSREEHPPLNTLGSKKWQKAKATAQKAIIGYARDLLNLQAIRKAKGGFSFKEDSEELLLFEEEFPFVPTDDQLKAIAATKKDMQSEKAMDRLVCGDVGYGKTEVAMRAAFKAVLDGKKQVAVLVPTTILAMQHYDTFRERMGNFPVNIGVVSRFIKPKEVTKTLEAVSQGAVDILIGTHRIVSQDVLFKDLGLIIIDEEQRFGVRVKEHLKKAKVGVDCLTLSATPIPRTLYFSLLGARDLSVINTPPQDRLPIKTIIAEKEDEVIQNALKKELSRDGQAYFIHNRIESIYQVAEALEKLLPAAKIAVVHGQMPSNSTDAIFHQFKRGEIDILVATTIVENGVDIPNANTILIDRANAYGMADLYQLRGRVGRWNLPAYAYFLIPKHRSLSELARKRLQALVATSGFGGGMKLAMQDLEIRGAGDLLGVQQSGYVSAIGFHFYCKLLKRTIETLKKEVPSTFLETKIEFAFAANLPPFYIGETSLRMEIYYRLGETTKNEEVDALFEELIDRFGPLPPQAKWLYHLNRIRIFASHHQFTLLKFEKNTLYTQRKIAGENKDKQEEEKRIPFPPCDDPADLEKIAIELLKRLAAPPLSNKVRGAQHMSS